MPTKFDFVSPGIELREIDQSTIAPVPEQDGILLIGRAKKGPAMKPIKINSISNFHQVFGTPMDGVKRNDPWREGNTGAGGWAAYAAEAYLAANIGPVKFVRLAGLEESSQKLAGWETPESKNINTSDNDGAMGLFVAENPTPNPVDEAYIDLEINLTDAPLADDTLTLEYVASTPSSIVIRFFDSAAPLVGDWATVGSVTEYAVDITGLATKADYATAIAAASLNNDGQTFISDFTITNNIDSLRIEQPLPGISGNSKFATAEGFTPLNFGAGSTGTEFILQFANGTQEVSGNAVLAAIFYVEGLSLKLSGTSPDGGTTDGAGLIKEESNGSFTMIIEDGDGDTQTKTFDFGQSSANNIRNVFNTDPTLFDSGVGRYNMKYFLGESFEYNVNHTLDSSKSKVAWIAGINSNNLSYTDHQQELTAAKTGWFISTEASLQKKLFRFEAIDEGGDFHKNYVVRIKDLKQASRINPNATFTVELAELGQSPSNYVEKFTGCTLNADSPNYISKKIGDLKLEWSVSKDKQISSGMFDNISDYIRVEVASGLNASDLPVGFVGPISPAANTTVTGDLNAQNVDWLHTTGVIPDAQNFFLGGAATLGFTSSVSWPTHELSGENTYINRNKNYPASFLHGLSYYAQAGDQNFGDIGFAKKKFPPHLAEGDPVSSASYVFSLEYLEADSVGSYFHKPNLAGTQGIADISNLISQGAKQFVAPFFGGHDGVDITIENPFNDTQLVANGYAQYSLEAALSQVSDSDIIRYDMISIPGVTATTINQDLIRLVEERGDALAIVDLNGIYQTLEDDGTGEDTGSVNAIITEVETGFNSSYAAAYYPNVRIKDVSNGSQAVLLAPPSVAAIGAISKSESVSQPWFAPAGFNRGALAPLGGPGGASVVGTLEHLNKADRDALYDVNINPIARFPATGETVIFGQKTLQQSASALDRINVRRMMIHLKKRVGDIANTILFEQSVSSTFDNFKSRVEPILLTLKNEFGVSDYKIVLDETTTTPDLQDRNIMYAKVFVKPARAIEFIAVDFVVTQSGVQL